MQGLFPKFSVVGVSVYLVCWRGERELFFVEVRRVVYVGCWS